MSHRAGFVNIIGNPNVGKSTLMNALVGERLSIITSKAQTTRHRIMGIVNSDDFQIVYSDTPGFIKPFYKMHEALMGFVETSLKDADVFLYMVEMGEKEHHSDIIDRVNKSGIPVILIINKIDTTTQEEAMKYYDNWKGVFKNGEIFMISALHGFNIEHIVPAIVEKLPLSPPFFPKEELTDRPMRFFVSEIIREKIFIFYQKEIPYSSEVSVESYKELNGIIHISAMIYTERESQKNIIIGKGGASIKRIGIEARKDIENFIDQKVFLELRVKVLENWRNNPLILNRLGYKP
ncbi:MAG: GTPase Era [Bacteroidales bacterium]|nr:GTPase Era [Bacteroidales bacterium]MDY0216165.1 GTPase Era [Bacteroidales bacterium]